MRERRRAGVLVGRFSRARRAEDAADGARPLFRVRLLDHHGGLPARHLTGGT
ncbi:hypothetical protein [Streptomyces eurythermus]|uniref:hypothetical protein n=1 Tax=Streptomyces eurythermus TaxID=42237 RepID=UPI0036D2D711